MEQKQQSGKRPLALPITLLILVMSVMGNVLLYTKNIEHSRGKAEAEGLAVYTHFEKAREELAYWIRLADEAAGAANANNEASRITAAYLSEAIARGEGELGALFLKAKELDETRFGEAPQAYESYIGRLGAFLAAIGKGSGPLSNDELEALASSKSDFLELDKLLGEFYYGGTDNRNVLVRLSGGHDWLTIAEKLQAAVLR
ncbi:hypothetical protein RB620_16975 [Paenibacillus sp. LHD-117]|uniref:hypothetical protein n=1 Tax=Paenibacillus sp. LHD-117 TaxID=3071412 RepID=UPI0027E1D33E|nr:hypothetical protein [Paenibacillus sp. LHD-117]MDQ6421123.1 hypothetical protein [Paenibacillus sp. LHD-117]